MNELQFKALRKECAKVMTALNITVAFDQLNNDLPLHLGDVDKLMSYFEEVTEEHRHGFNQIRLKTSKVADRTCQWKQ